MKENFWRCVCGSEILLIDSTYLELEDELHFAMFRYFPRDKSIKERFRCIWNIIKTGYPFTDSMIFHKNQLEEIGKHLINLSKETKNAK